MNPIVRGSRADSVGSAPFDVVLEGPVIASKLPGDEPAGDRLNSFIGPLTSPLG
jgi:hypothetical protein